MGGREGSRRQVARTLREEVLKRSQGRRSTFNGGPDKEVLKEVRRGRPERSRGGRLERTPSWTRKVCKTIALCALLYVLAHFVPYFLGQGSALLNESMSAGRGLCLHRGSRLLSGLSART